MTVDSLGRTRVSAPPARWTDMAGAWLGIGTSPGALLLGAGLAARHQGPVPALSLVLGFAAIAVLVWFQWAMLLMAAVGMLLAILRFDQSLLNWLSLLAAVLPTLIVPLAFESTARRRNRQGRVLPVWLWLSGAAVSVVLIVAHHLLALLAGLFVSAAATLIWYTRHKGIA